MFEKIKTRACWLVVRLSGWFFEGLAAYKLLIPGNANGYANTTRTIEQVVENAKHKLFD